MNILIAEDDTTSRLVLAATLKKLGHNVTAVENGRQAWEAWQRESFPIVISDWMMPEMDGMELCRTIRAQPQLHYSYIILLTAHGGKMSYLEGMEAGADDFITKPFDEDQLSARLHAAKRILDLHDTLRAQAMHDGLTGLWNRTAIVQRLQQELERAEREGSCLGVIMADIDRFKQINDTYGHVAGDRVLQAVTRRMEDSLRSYDKIGRYGGEEFLIVVPSGNICQAHIVAERIRSRVAAEPVQLDSGPLPVTLSLGVVASRPDQWQSAEDIIDAADKALYNAKNTGRNRVQVSECSDEVCVIDSMQPPA